MAIMCFQCEDPSCLKVCPVHAIRRDENGAVVMNPDKCIGCMMRLNACPLGNISYHPAVGRVFKCDLCGGEPRCARYCPSGAISFVDTDTVDERRKAVSDKPVYLYINDGTVELRDASHLWGKDVFETTNALYAECGENFRVACISAAGETGCLFAGIMSDKHRAAGRGGMGAVMGSKKLKELSLA